MLATPKSISLSQTGVRTPLVFFSTQATEHSSIKLPIQLATLGPTPDTKIDLIVCDNSRTFINQTTYSTGTNPWSVTTADVNGDTKIDLIVANWGSNTVGVCLFVEEKGKFIEYPFERIMGRFSSSLDIRECCRE